jgi:c-di-GMP-binding flagellar brake protein YcgR
MGTLRSRTTASRTRRYARLAVDLEGTLVGRVVHPVRLVDLSLGGCLARCDALLEPGAILDLQLPLEQEPFTAKVRVIDSSLDGSAVAGQTASALTGLDFVSLSARDESRLRLFLEDERRRRRSADAPSQ